MRIIRIGFVDFFRRVIRKIDRTINRRRYRAEMAEADARLAKIL